MANAADPAEQIAELQAIKRSLSPAERKLDSRIAVDLKTAKTRLKSGLTEVDIVPTRTRRGPDGAADRSSARTSATPRRAPATCAPASPSAS